MPKSMDERRNILDKAIQPYLKRGWIIQSQGDTRAQLIQKRERGCVGKIMFGIWDLIFKRKGDVLNIDVDEDGRVHERRSRVHI